MMESTHNTIQTQSKAKARAKAKAETKGKALGPSDNLDDFVAVYPPSPPDIENPEDWHEYVTSDEFKRVKLLDYTRRWQWTVRKALYVLPQMKPTEQMMVLYMQRVLWP